MSSDGWVSGERPEHDDWCESEFIHEAGGYTPCDCDNRNELRRRGFTVTKALACGAPGGEPGRLQAASDALLAAHKAHWRNQSDGHALARLHNAVSDWQEAVEGYRWDPSQDITAAAPGGEPGGDEWWDDGAWEALVRAWARRQVIYANPTGFDVASQIADANKEVNSAFATVMRGYDIAKIPAAAPGGEQAPERWGITKFDPTLILPKPWADDEMDPEQRGPWQTVHCGDAATARIVCDLLNRSGVEPVQDPNFTPRISAPPASGDGPSSETTPHDEDWCSDPAEHLPHAWCETADVWWHCPGVSNVRVHAAAPVEDEGAQTETPTPVAVSTGAEREGRYEQATERPVPPAASGDEGAQQWRCANRGPSFTLRYCTDEASRSHLGHGPMGCGYVTPAAPGTGGET